MSVICDAQLVFTPVVIELAYQAQSKSVFNLHFDFAYGSRRWIHRSSAKPQLMDECLGRRKETEALSRCRVVGPDDVEDALVAVVAELGLSSQVAGKAQVAMMEAQLNKLGTRLAEAEAEVQRQHRETRALKQSYDQYLQAAQVLQVKLSDGQDPAEVVKIEVRETRAENPQCRSRTEIHTPSNGRSQSAEGKCARAGSSRHASGRPWTPMAAEVLSDTMRTRNLGGGLSGNGKRL